MSKLRFNALKETFERKPIEIKPVPKRSAIFGQKVFGKESMRDYLDKNAYKAVMSAIEKGKKIDRNMAEQVAAGMKNWAIANGLPITHIGFNP